MSEDEQIILAFARSRGEKGFKEAEVCSLLTACKLHLRLADLIRRAIRGELNIELGLDGHLEFSIAE